MNIQRATERIADCTLPNINYGLVVCIRVSRIRRNRSAILFQVDEPKNGFSRAFKSGILKPVETNANRILTPNSSRVHFALFYSAGNKSPADYHIIM